MTSFRIRTIAAVALALALAACMPERYLAPDAPRSSQSANTTPLSAPFAYGVASGDMTSESAILWTRTASAASVIPELSLTPSFENARALPAATSSAAHDFAIKVLADGLQPGTRYYYRFQAGSDVSPVGTFRTAYAPDDHASITLAFTGDADWKWKPYPLLASLVQENADFFLFLGDLIYETTDYENKTVAEDLAAYRWKYRENREPRAGGINKTIPMRDLYAAFGQYSVIDNHESGMSRTDANGPRYTEGGARFQGGFVNHTRGFRDRLQAYSEYQPVREEMHAGTGDARTDGTTRFYRAIPWGAALELIVVDDRSYRDQGVSGAEKDEAASCSRTMLGAVQLKWFEEALLSAQRRGATWKAVVISSPIQEFGTKSQVGVDLDGFKSWAGSYRCERDRILKFIDDQRIDNVVFLTTDNHYTAINNLMYSTVPGDRRSPRKAARNAFEILTGPLGAGTGTPPYGRKIDLEGLARRDADRRILEVWHGERADEDGKRMGLEQAGLDPIGLEANFPGLDVASIRASGVKPGTAEPLAFASFKSFGYAVLTFDQAQLHVVVKTTPAVNDPATLLKPDALQSYESRRAEETLSFTVRAQPGGH